MIDISKHITMRDATCSKYADAHGIKNEPSKTVISNMQHLAQTVFEPLWHHFGVPLKINSFYRSIALNRAIGGSITSQHVLGQAMDITSSGNVSNRQLFDYIRTSLPFDQLIWEFGDDHNPTWIHVSLSKSFNRNQVLRSRRRLSGSVYYEIIP